MIPPGPCVTAELLPMPPTLPHSALNWWHKRDTFEEPGGWIRSCSLLPCSLTSWEALNSYLTEMFTEFLAKLYKPNTKYSEKEF